jgi:hypothetical protein
MRPADDSPIAETKALSGLCTSQASTQGARSILSALCVWPLPATEQTESTVAGNYFRAAAESP